MENDFRSNVVIDLTSEIEHGGHTEKTQQKLDGEWFRRGDTHTLRYYEDEHKTTTLIKWEHNASEILIIRQGGVALRLVIAPGYPLETVYSTPYGNFTMNVMTHHLDMDVTEAGGSFRFAYQSFLNDGDLSEHRMTIHFRILS